MGAFPFDVSPKIFSWSDSKGINAHWLIQLEINGLSKGGLLTTGSSKMLNRLLWGKCKDEYMTQMRLSQAADSCKIYTHQVITMKSLFEPEKP